MTGKKRIVGLLGMLLSQWSFAVNPGDIGFIAVQSDNFAAFAIMVVQPLPPNTVIRFTDNAWLGNALAVNENTMTWTSPNETLPTGHVVRFFDSGLPFMSVIGGGTTSGKLSTLSQNGDQILAYTGLPSNPSFIAGISTSSWLSECQSTPNPIATCLPPPLENGVNAIAFTNGNNNFDNGFWNVTNFAGTPEELLLAINTVGNWLVSENPGVAGYDTWPNWGAPISNVNVPSAIRFENATYTITEGAPQINIKLLLQFPQVTQQTLALNVGLFPGTTLDDFVTNPAVVNNKVPLTVPPGQTEISFSIQAPLDGLVETDEVVSFTMTDLSSGLSLGTPSIAAVTILNMDNSETAINFVNDTIVITEGQTQFTNVPLAVLPPLNQAGQVQLQFVNGPGVSNFDYLTQPALNASNIMTLPIEANASGVSFNIAPLNDTEIEPDEYVTIRILSASVGYEIGIFDSLIVKIIDNDAPVPVVIPNVVINEINAANQFYGSDEYNEFDDWIELFNVEDFAVQVNNFYISNDPNLPLKYRFPNAQGPLTVPSQGYRLVWADNFTAQGPWHANFTLANSGGFVSLYFSDGATLLDSTSYPAMNSFQSFARIPNGSGPFKLVYSPSPAKANIDTVPEGVNVHLYQPQAKNSAIRLFPNPGQDWVTVVWLSEETQAQISIITMDGRMVAHKQLAGSHQFHPLDIDYLADGIYMVLIEWPSGQREQLRLVKQR